MDLESYIWLIKLFISIISSLNIYPQLLYSSHVNIKNKVISFTLWNN
jgi:hypothetical protein